MALTKDERKWQGIALIASGALVIGLVDNLLRPLLVGRDTHLPDWLVLLATIGGIALIGINGFVVGPVVAAMFVAVRGLVGRHADRHEAVPGIATAAATTAPAPPVLPPRGR